MKFKGGAFVRRPFQTRLAELARVGSNQNISKQQKQALALIKNCVQRNSSKKQILHGLQVLLQTGAVDPGAALLAEYVAARSGRRETQNFVIPQ